MNLELKSEKSLSFYKDKYRKEDSSKSESAIWRHQEQLLEEELCQIIKLIKDCLPDKSLEKTIQMMNDYIVKKKPPQKVFCDYVPPLLHIPSAPKKYRYRPRPIERPEVSLVFEKGDYQKPIFNSQSQSRKYWQRRVLAKSYVAYGFSYKSVEKEFQKARQFYRMPQNGGVEITCPKAENYQSELKIVMGVAFLRLENFLMKYCFIQIKTMPLGDKQKVIEALWKGSIFSSGSVFNKFLRLEYGLSSVTLNQIQTVQFYLQAMKFLHRKRMTVQGVQLFYSGRNGLQTHSDDRSVNSSEDVTVPQQELSEKITAENSVVDSYLLQAYKNERSFKKILPFLRKSYGWTWGELRARFLELIKRALNQVAEDALKQKQCFPRMSSLTETGIKTLFQHKEAEDVRINLLDYYCDPSGASENDLLFLVEMANWFLGMTIQPSERADFVSDFDEIQSQRTVSAFAGKR